MTNPTVMAELIRRAQLARQLNNMNGQSASPEGPSQQSPIQSLPNGPPPGTAMPDNRQYALDQYREAQKQPAPSLGDYHPSIGRRILGAVAGGIEGMHDARLGMQVGHDVTYGPFDRKMSDYQQKLAQKKQAFEDEEKASEGEARIGHLKAQGEAEVERKGAEKARGEAEKYKTSQTAFDRAKELALLKLKPPVVEKARNVIVPLKNGEKVAASEGPDGSYRLQDGTVLGPDTIDLDKGVTPLERPNPVMPPPHFDEQRGMVVNMPPGGTPSAVPVSGMSPKPTETPEDKEKIWQKHNAITSAQAADRAKTSQAATRDRQDHAADIKEGQPSPGAKARAETAEKLLPHIDKVDSLIKSAEKSLGPLKGKWSEFMTGKLGTKDPAFSELRTELKFLAAGVTQMHTGSRGSAAYLKEFNDLLSAGMQDPENLRKALKVTKSYATDYSHVGKGKRTEQEVDDKAYFDSIIKK